MNLVIEFRVQWLYLCILIARDEPLLMLTKNCKKINIIAVNNIIAVPHYCDLMLKHLKKKTRWDLEMNLLWYTAKEISLKNE